MKKGVYKVDLGIMKVTEDDAKVEALCSALEVLWEGILERIFKKVGLSMKKRIKVVIKARGWYTKY